MISDNEKFNMQVKPNSAFLDELKAKLPEFFDCEGNFDLDKFKGQLEEHNINELKDGYQLNFIGKDYARRQAGERPSTVIVPDQEQNNVEGKDSKNLFFTGDNLEVLRHLQNNYAGKIDVIYIDPPYNTGNDDFVYPDTFEYSDEKIKEMFGIDDEQIKRLKSIQGKSSHSSWLTFMYPRLMLAKKLLSNNGIIFISLDDNEQANLRNLLNFLMGENNFIASMIVKRKSGPNNVGIIPSIHDYLLVYARDILQLGEDIGLPLKRKGYSNPDNDPRGPWTTMPLSANHVGPHFKITNPKNGKTYLPSAGRYWVFNEKEVEKRIKDGRIIFGKSGETAPVQKVFLSDRIAAGKKQKIGTIIENEGINNRGTKELEELLGNSKVFDTPKPSSLIKFILKIINNKNAIVLDFFAGSSTTADAVMQLNAEDGGNRKFIMVQLPEKTYTVNSDGKEVPTKGGKAAYEAGFKSIDEISRERIRRAVAKIKTDNDLTLPKDFDGSFKHYRVVNPTKQTLEDIEDFDPDNTTLFTDMVDSFSSKGLDVAGDATGEQTILTTWLAKDGYSFDADIKKIDFDGYEASLVEDSRLYIINNGWSSENTKALLNKIGTHQITVQTIVLFGYSFNIADLRELEIGLKQLDGNINLLKRY
ncbi:site-specific DNA-methyltransferase [Ligilactobacillus salivarius]|uniref:site-specific DNA-methyltransferase n=1 Tax=Ligilactobacillus salivarius TaxID=1624 RepID=UPI0009DACDA7|nr:site-specific DNA-methyltransferase [Ligilactobacillus salivarius]OQR09344.1 site-specific DNA-methyltransferase [Ligilactobacillus salivarius]